MFRRFLAAGHLHNPVGIRQIIKQTGKLIKKQWQVVLQTTAGQTLGNILIERAVAMVDIKTLAKGTAEMADAFRAEGKIYVVVAVTLIVLVGLFVYLFMLDRKLSKLERMIDAKTQTKPERKSF